jgi:hypothetical protein
MEINNALYNVLHNKVLIAIAVLLMLDVVTGIASAAYNKTFALGSLGDWLLTRAFPYVLVDVALQIVIVFGLADYVPQLAELLGDAVHGFVVLTLVGKILDNVHGMNIATVPMALRNTETPKVKVTL